MTNSTQTHFQTNVSAKLRFPSSITKNHWTVEEITQRKLFAVPFLGALMIVACAKPTTKSDLFNFLIAKIQFDVEQFEKNFKGLISKKSLFLMKIIRIINRFLIIFKTG